MISGDARHRLTRCEPPVVPPLALWFARPRVASCKFQPLSRRDSFGRRRSGAEDSRNRIWAREPKLGARGNEEVGGQVSLAVGRLWRSVGTRRAANTPPVPVLMKQIKRLNDGAREHNADATEARLALALRPTVALRRPSPTAGPCRRPAGRLLETKEGGKQ